MLKFRLYGGYPSFRDQAGRLQVRLLQVTVPRVLPCSRCKRFVALHLHLSELQKLAINGGKMLAISSVAPISPRRGTPQNEIAA